MRGYDVALASLRDLVRDTQHLSAAQVRHMLPFPLQLLIWYCLAQSSFPSHS